MRRILPLLAVLLVIPFHQAPSADHDPYRAERRRMIEKDVAGRGISDAAVLGAMAKVPRHLFVGPAVRDRAYGDHPLPIGEGQTISQPYVVALMTQALRLGPQDRVLEVGTGSGYQAAVLAEIVHDVFTIEIRKTLFETAEKTLAGLGYANIRTRHGDGYFGWSEHGPYDAIIITAAANHIPPPLLDQLKEGGRLILPLGSTVYYQTLTLVTKRSGEPEVEQMGGVAFVPMVGEMRSDRK